MVTVIVSKKAIADYLGLDRYTVSKILNHKGREKFAARTVEQVEQAAKELGFRSLRRRSSPRAAGPQRARLNIILQASGALVASGTAQVADISENGMLLKDFQLAPAALPVKPFQIEILFERGELAGMSSLARPVRFAPVDAKWGLGVAFEPLAVAQHQRISPYVKEHPPGLADTDRN